MKARGVNQKRELALSCLLAEQVAPQELLLWRSHPDPRRSSAARARRLLARKTPHVIAIGISVVGGLLAALGFFIATTQGTPIEAALPGSALAWLLAVLATCLLVYAAPRILHDASITRPLWWRLLAASPLGPLARQAARRGESSLVEPPLVPALRGREVYGLTDRRVIILEVGKRRQIRSLWLNDITRVQCVDAADGWGDLILAVSSSGLTPEAPGRASTALREATRMFGIEQARCVEQALRCLLAHRPLEDAIGALTDRANPAPVPGTPARPAYRIRAQQWQALLWRGPTRKELEATVIYGASLPQLRARARTFLLSQRPGCFCNCPPPSGRQFAPSKRYALYSCSEHVEALGVYTALMPAAAMEIAMPDLSEQDGSQVHTKPHYRGRKASGAARTARAAQTIPDTPSHEHAEQESLLSSPPKEKQGNQPCHWMRESPVVDPHPERIVTDFESAVDKFVEQDLLAERGPTYFDELLARQQPLLHAQTIQRVDDVSEANDLLHRGGWHVLQIMGMTAPRGQFGPVLFILGHPEDKAV